MIFLPRYAVTFHIIPFNFTGTSETQVLAGHKRKFNWLNVIYIHNLITTAFLNVPIFSSFSRAVHFFLS